MSPRTQIRTDFPHKIRQLKHLWIPMSDGTKLAARVWLPTDADQNPVPAILEYIPYRLTDGTAQRDAVRHPYLAGHGYAAVRVDQRGSGNSDGIMYDEYLPQEQADGVEVIAWLAAQPWCNGNVGMFGKSWGGFNALQVAAHRPPALKAIISIYSTDDRYADDVHYVGGCVLGSQMLSWATTMLAYNASPPDPTVVGEGWRELWLARLDKTPPYINEWLSHQRRDAFWQQGSVCEDFSAIECAVYAVGGWADGYTNVVPRLLAGLTAPRKGLIGPWSHNFPEVAEPAPTIGFLQESLRWWDYWLKGIENSIMDEPMLTAWLQDSEPPRAYYPEWSGRWIAEPADSIQNQPQIWHLSENGKATSRVLRPTQQVTQQISTSLSHGENAGIWFHMGEAGGYPTDQRHEDNHSATFDTPPVAEPTSYFGFPTATLTLSGDQPVAHVTLRLCDIAPNGESTLVSWGALNLTHRHSHADPTPIVPHKKMTVQVPLNLIGHTLATGHHWRIAIAPTYFPHVWTPPQPVTLTLYLGESSLSLPAWNDNGVIPVPFLQPEVAPPLDMVEIRPAKNERLKIEDLIAGISTLTFTNDSGRTRFPDGLEYDHKTVDIYTYQHNDPNSATAECHRELVYKRGNWQVAINATAKMTATATHFQVDNLLEAQENEQIAFNRSWSFSIPRDLV